MIGKTLNSLIFLKLIISNIENLKSKIELNFKSFFKELEKYPLLKQANFPELEKVMPAVFFNHLKTWPSTWEGFNAKIPVLCPQLTAKRPGVEAN